LSKKRLPRSSDTDAWNAHRPSENQPQLSVVEQDAINNGTSKGVSAQCLFDLLQSLEGDTPDILDILELVKAEKPLKSLGNSKALFIQ